MEYGQQCSLHSPSSLRVETPRAQNTSLRTATNCMRQHLLARQPKSMGIGIGHLRHNSLGSAIHPRPSPATPTPSRRATSTAVNVASSISSNRPSASPATTIAIRSIHPLRSSNAGHAIHQVMPASKTHGLRVQRHSHDPSHHRPRGRPGCLPLHPHRHTLAVAPIDRTLAPCPNTLPQSP